MKVKYYLVVTGLVVTTMFGCSKSKDSVTPENNPDLLVRKWAFNEISVKTDAKTYVIPPADDATFFGEDNTVTFNKDNTYSAVENGKTVPVGTWKLSTDKKVLSLTDVEGTTALTINSLTSTNIELASVNVDMTKPNQPDDVLNVAFVAGMLLYTIDKDYGGTVDFSKEPDPKTIQLILKGKGI